MFVYRPIGPITLVSRPAPTLAPEEALGEMKPIDVVWAQYHGQIESAGVQTRVGGILDGSRQRTGRLRAPAELGRQIT